MPNAVILATGSYVPERRVKTREMEAWTFENRLGQPYHVLAAEVIEKTGIEERRYAASDEATSDLAARAGKQALENAGVHPDDVDLVLLATSTPDYHVPKCAPLVAHKLGMHGVPAYDFGKDCTGFIEALEAASYYIRAERHERILVIGADICSRLVNPKNKASAILFGDGAGALLLGAGDEPERGFLLAVSGSQGEDYDKLYIPAGGSALPHNTELSDLQFRLVSDPDMVATFGRQTLAVGLERVLAERGLSPENLDLLVPHQASLRLIESVCQALDIPRTKVVMTADRFGNTGAASVAMALDTAQKDGRLKPGSLVGLVAFGAGLSWISALVRI